MKNAGQQHDCTVKAYQLLIWTGSVDLLGTGRKQPALPLEAVSAKLLLFSLVVCPESGSENVIINQLVKVTKIHYSSSKMKPSPVVWPGCWPFWNWRNNSSNTTRCRSASFWSKKHPARPPFHTSRT